MRIWAFLVVTLLADVCAGQADLRNSLLQDLSVSIGSGARAMGMGGAFIAVADDATAASWNPAGLCVLEKPEVSVVWKPYSRVAGSSPLQVQEERVFGTVLLISSNAASTVLNGSTVDFISGAYPVQFGKLRLVPQINYQRAIQLGLHGGSSPGIFRLLDLNSGVENISQTISKSDVTGGIDLWSASIGFSFDPRIFLGVSVNRWTGNPKSELTLTFERTTCSPDECSSEGSRVTKEFIEENYDGANINIGALVRPHRKFRIGVVYKTPFEMELFRSGTTAPFGFMEIGKIEWPSTIGAGISIVPNDALTISADYTRTGWSSARYVLQRIGDQFPGSIEDETRNWPTSSDQTNSSQKRLGAEYVFLRKYIISLRAGIFKDRQLATRAQPDGPAKETLNFLGWTLGAGITFPRISLDVAFVRETGEFSGCDFFFVDDFGSHQCRSFGNNQYESSRVFVSSIFYF